MNENTHFYLYDIIKGKTRNNTISLMFVLNGVNSIIITRLFQVDRPFLIRISLYDIMSWFEALFSNG